MSKLLFFISIILTLLFTTSPVYGENIVSLNKMYEYEDLIKDIGKLKNGFPQLIQLKTVGYSHFGHKIIGIRLGKGKKNILIIGAHHGREWLTSALMMQMLEEYTVAYRDKKSYGPFPTNILDEVSIWFVPMLNPDGVMIQQKGVEDIPFLYQRYILAMNNGSHNFSRWKSNGIGIDLNRQYPAGWEQIKNKYKSPSFQFYKGNKPLEALEVKAITNFTYKIKPLVAVAYHSSGREIFWEYKNGIHMHRDRKIAKKVAKLTQYKLSVPEDHAIGGGYTDWFITKFQKPGLTIEICPLIQDTSPPISIFNEEWERNKYIGLMLVEEALKLTDTHK